MKPKRSPVEQCWQTLFFYPRPASKERTRACPRGFVYGCPAKNIPPKDKRLSLFMGYYVYFEHGFSFSDFLAEPAIVRESMFAIKSAANRRENREIEKSREDITAKGNASKNTVSGKKPSRFRK
jgi:hypothetical protein